MRYYIADLHFFHGNLNEKMDHRGFSSEEEMHAYMIKQWNRKVRDNDEVVILGDFSLGNAEETGAILEQLKGKLYFIQGNHDKFLRKESPASTRFLWIKPYAEISDSKKKIVLSHYPIFCYNGQYRMDDTGAPKAYMLYGHVHNTMDEEIVNDYINQVRNKKRVIKGKGNEELQNIPCNMINCFCMFSDYTPMSLKEWIEIDSNRRLEMNKKSVCS